MSDPMNPLYNDLLNYSTQISIRSAFRSIHYRIDIYGNSTVPYLACVLAVHGRVLAEFLVNLS